MVGVSVRRGKAHTTHFVVMELSTETTLPSQTLMSRLEVMGPNSLSDLLGYRSELEDAQADRPRRGGFLAVEEMWRPYAL